jgi:DNA repair protein RecO (recombination protein O)
VEALGRPLAQAPDAAPGALAQAERAVRETAEHHAGIRLPDLRPAARSA